MSFWNQKSIEPKQKFRFVVKIGEEILYNVKSVTKPIFTTETRSYTLLNHRFKYPGIATWEPISITFVDGVVDAPTRLAPGGEFESVLNDMIQGTAYRAPNNTSGPILSAPTKASTITKSFFNVMNGSDSNLSIGQIVIEQQDANGNFRDSWTIHGPIITSISFGDLAYESDDLVEYKMDIEYDFATYNSIQIRGN